MPNPAKELLLQAIQQRYGKLRKCPGSRSLFHVGSGDLLILLRYSRLHHRNRTFYGLREQDLRELEGHPSLICFVWDGQEEPLFLPFADYEDAFRQVGPAPDGQYKVQIYVGAEGTELYIARAGRHSVDAYLGWDQIDALAGTATGMTEPDLTHSQVQTLLGSIGFCKGFDIWVPPNDRGNLDWSLAHEFHIRSAIPEVFGKVKENLERIDVIWLEKGGKDLRALYEVEHSTPIYSGLLRFNDLLLSAPRLDARFGVVANEERRQLFVQQLNRPTFTASGLSEKCTFFKYHEIYRWHERVVRGQASSPSLS